jgi:hypothetical protein
MFIILTTVFSAGSKIVAQQTNIALVAALLLTVQFSFAYTLPSIWDPLVTPGDSSASYLLALMTEDQVNIVHEVRGICRRCPPPLTRWAGVRYHHRRQPRHQLHDRLLLRPGRACPWRAQRCAFHSKPALL